MQAGWGFWNFLKLRVNEFDLKQCPSAEMAEILEEYKNEPEIFKKNFFIFNDPKKPKAKEIKIDPELLKV